MSDACLELHVKSNEVVQATKSLKDLAASADRTAASADKLAGGSKKAAEAADRLKDRAKGANGGLRGLGDAAGEAAKKLAVMAAKGAMAYFAIKRIVSVVKKSISKSISIFSEYGRSVSDLSAITGATGDQLKYLDYQAKQIGSTTSLSASQAAEAFKLIASAKPDLLDNAAALNQVTRSAVMLAEASGVDLKDAAEGLGLVLNQFSLDASEADRVINVLAAGAKFGASAVEQTSEALKGFGNTAANSKISIEESTAAIQMLAAAGIRGAEAGTSLRNIILILNKSMDESLRPSAVGLAKALQNLNDKNLDGIELAKLFGVGNVDAAAGLLKNADAMATMSEKLTGTNTALEQSSIRMSDLKGAAQNLGSALEGLYITIGERLAPATKQLFEWLAESAKLTSKFIDSWSDAPTTLEGARVKLARIRELLERLEEAQKIRISVGESIGIGAGAFSEREKQIADLRLKALDLRDIIANLQGKAGGSQEPPTIKITGGVVDEPTPSAIDAPKEQSRAEIAAAERAARELRIKQQAADSWLYDVQRYQMTESQLVDRWFSEQITKLEEYNKLRPESASEAANALIAIEEERERKLAEIQERITRKASEETRKQEEVGKEASRAMIEQTKFTSGLMAGLLQDSGRDSTAAYKVLLAAQKALAIPSIVVSTEQAAAAASAHEALKGGMFGAISAASLIRAQGAISVGVVAGQAFAGLFDDGGYIPKGSYGIVGERGPEIVRGPANVTSRKETAALARSALSGGGGESSATYITINNNISGNGDQALAQAVETATEQALIRVQQDFATNGKIRRTAGI